MDILVLFAHPRLSGSVVQKAMLAAIARTDRITVHDLYAAYPDFAIDVAREQKLLLAHQLIVFQHPLYWYSAPAIFKEWLDLVLENRWAYGPGGTRLAGKFLMSAVSSGGSAAAYTHHGHNRFTIEELLAPFNQTAWLCNMAWLAPFVIHAGRRMAPDDLATCAEAYRDLLVGLRDGTINPFTRLTNDGALPPAFGPKAA